MSRQRLMGMGTASVAAIGAIAVGMFRGIPAAETFWRAVLVAAVGYLLGWGVIGRWGAAVVREAAGEGAEARVAKGRAGARPPAGT